MGIKGIPVGQEEMEERCAKCKKQLLMLTFLDLSTKERIFAVKCKHCNTEPIEVNRIKEHENMTKLKNFKPKKTNFYYQTSLICD